MTYYCDPDGTMSRPFPTLVNLCQRVAASHVDGITSLGDDLTYPLVKPILDRCDAEQLSRLEQSSPHLQADTPEIWKNLCFTTFPLAMQKYSLVIEGEPSSWKNQYFVFHDAEAKRLEEASARLRSQRLEAEERKKEREVKITDRVPPPKRLKTGWGTSPQPKTLFQKTRSEASKLRNGMHSIRVFPPMPNGKTFRVLPKPPDATLAFSSAPGSTPRVTVNTVVRRTTSLSISSPSMTSTTSLHSASSLSSTLPKHTPTEPATPATPQKPPRPVESSERPPLKRPSPLKRDPMASLFVPKRRAPTRP